jgi:hypothetical protein
MLLYYLFITLSQQIAKITCYLVEKENYIKGIKLWIIIPDYIQKQFENKEIGRKSISATRFYSSKSIPSKKIRKRHAIVRSSQV